MANTTIENLTFWDAAIKSWEANDHQAAINSLFQIQPMSAKILYNIGSAYLTIEAYDDALTALSDAVEKDSYMAVAYFQLGCVLFHLKRYRDSRKMFEKCYTELRGKDVIDYTQLGLHYKLYACEVVHNIGVTYSRANDIDQAKDYVKEAQKSKKETRHKEFDQTLASIRSGHPVNLMELPHDCLFHPNKQLLKNMAKKDYLGIAVVKAAVDEETGSFSGFDGPRNKQAMTIASLAPKSEDNTPEGSPRLFLRKIRAANGGLKLPSPDAGRKGKKSPNSSNDSSPSGTLERTTGPAPLLPPRSKPRNGEPKTSETIDPKDLLPPPTIPPKGSQNSNVVIKVTEAAPSKPPPRPKVQSKGVKVNGMVIPPPPSRPPPKLKSDKPLPSEPETQSQNDTLRQRPPPPPPKISPKPRKKNVTVTLHCHTDEEISVVYGTKHSDLLTEACRTFNMDLDTVDLWAQSESTGEMERIDDDSEMTELWGTVKTDQLELWCYGKS